MDCTICKDKYEVEGHCIFDSKCCTIDSLNKEIQELRLFKKETLEKQQKVIKKVNNSPFSKTYFIMDGSEKTFDFKEEIKMKGGRWDKDFRCWCIEDPLEETLSLFKTLGLKVQAK